MARTPSKKSAAKQTIGHSPNYGWGLGAIDFTGGSLTPLVNSLALLNDMRLMWLTDETAGAMKWCISSTMAQVHWTFEPQVDGEADDKDPEAVKWAKWANTLLLDMRGSFADHVEDALAMIWGGFAPCEITLRQRDGIETRFDDNYWGIEKLSLRDPRTVIGWDYDDKENLIAMRQQAPAGAGTIPIWKLCHYRTTSELDNPNGLSLLLPARRPWLLKNKIQDSEAIGIERDLVGLPVMRIPSEVIETANEVDGEGNATDAALEAQEQINGALKAVKDMRFNKSGGLVIPSDTYSEDVPTDHTAKWDFKIVTTGGARTIDTRTAARDYDRAIARVLMMQFLHLGDRSTGSYSLSDDQSSMAYKSFMALAVKIADEFTIKAVRLVWEVNGFDKKYMPKLRPGEIGKQAYQALGALMAGYAKLEDLWGSDVDQRAAIAKQLGLPFTRDAQEAHATATLTAAKNNAKPKPAPGANNEDPSPSG